MRSKPTCFFHDCDRPHYAHGWCEMHYARLRRRGTTEVWPRSTAERFWSKVDKSGECWLWTGALSKGYGHFRDAGGVGSNIVAAHRWAYEQEHGPIAAGLHLDHLCRTPACVRPAHLEPVTPRTNYLRGTSLAAQNAVKTHCKRGHPFDLENTVYEDGTRRCRICKNERARAYEAKLRAQQA